SRVRRLIVHPTSKLLQRLRVRPRALNDLADFVPRRAGRLEVRRQRVVVGRGGNGGQLVVKPRKGRVERARRLLGAASRAPRRLKLLIEGIKRSLHRRKLRIGPRLRPRAGRGGWSGLRLFEVGFALGQGDDRLLPGRAELLLLGLQSLNGDFAFQQIRRGRGAGGGDVIGQTLEQQIFGAALRIELLDEAGGGI